MRIQYSTAFPKVKTMTLLHSNSTFADQYLNDMDEATLVQYDKVINRPSNDWELYYWITEAKPTPQEYEGPVMDMLKVHAKNRNMDVRIRQPDLQPLDNWNLGTVICDPSKQASLKFSKSFAVVGTTSS